MSTPNPAIPQWLQVIELLLRMTDTLIAHFETGRTFNPADIRAQHSQAKEQLATLYQSIAQGGSQDAKRD